jgi:hypothetical protein
MSMSLVAIFYHIMLCMGSSHEHRQLSQLNLPLCCGSFEVYLALA